MDQLRSTQLGPLRKVEKPLLRAGSSPLSTFKYHWWELHLECGHVLEQRCRYAHMDRAPRGWAAMHRGASLDRLLDAPRRARCGECLRRSA